MNASKFISCLEEYVGRKVNYKITDSAIKVYVDNETCYSFDWHQAKIDMYERNIKTEIGSFGKFSKVNFAMLLRTVFNNSAPCELEECDSLENLVGKYDDKYCSVGSVQVGKVSIILNDEYEIMYKTDKRKYIIDKSTDKKYIFDRFYYEVAYFTSFMNNLKDYETIFNETFSEEEIVDWIYNKKTR